MNSHPSSAIAAPAKSDFHLAFVDGAIDRLAAAVSSRAASTATPGKVHGSLASSLSRILQHFGCVVDDVSLAVAARDGDVEAIVRRVCEQHHLHIREVELKQHETRIFGAPILAFRGAEAVVLLPGMWRRWSEIDATGGATGDLEPRAYTFYRSLPPEPARMRDLWRTVFGRENARDLTYALLWGVLAATLSAASVYLMRSLVEWALPEGDRSSLTLLACGWAVVAITASNLRLSRALLQTRVGTRMDVSTEAALVGRALSLPLRVFKGIGSGDLSERIRDASMFGRQAYSSAIDISLATASVIAYAVTLATTSSRAALAVGGVVLVRAAIGSVLLAGAYRGGKAQAIARGGMSARLFELLSSIARIKVASAEPRAFYQWATTFATVRRSGYSASLYSGMLSASEGVFDVLGTIVLYAACCAPSHDVGMNVGSFVVAAACLGGLQGAYSELVRGMMMLLPMFPKAARIRPLLEASAEVHSGASSASLDGNVSLRNVTFHYADDDVRILDNVSLDIKKGQFVAIVGPSGCGKSTLIKMILGFYAPSSGTVLLDGKDLQNLDIRAVRRQTGAVLQGSELLPSSILFNIVGTSKKTLADAWTAARRARIADDIEQMPMKMFTAISDRAVTISGGQKQRILIARALVREPQLVIFDEATSALDNKTQAGVMDALHGMPCTKIFIAHRLSTVVNADRIIVMNKGTIVQEGTYASLMREAGLFRTLAETQTSEQSRRA